MAHNLDDYDGYDGFDDPDEDGSRLMFADPGGRSALRAATSGKCPSCKKRIGATWDHCAHCGRELNPRKHPCPTCGNKNVLTTEDVRRGYQCNTCADRAEGTYRGGDY